MASDLRDQLQTALGDAYSLERELEGGGMSRIFVGTDVKLGRQIAVKALRAETGAAVSVERFQREIQVAARLQHPHIVPVLMAGDASGVPFYIMPLVKGESLRARLTRSGELAVNDTVHILRDVAAALAYAHAEGIVHRDIKPDNVMLAGSVAVVTDFGVAKAIAAARSSERPERGGAPSLSADDGTDPLAPITTLGVALGTPAYMSPEQAAADPHVDRRADIYAFGCMAYEMLAGSTPFAGRSPQQQLAAHVTESPEPLLKRRPKTPAPLAALVMRCLEKRAGDRPQSADELITALDAVATPGAETSVARLARVRPNRRRSVVVVGGMLAAGVLALALVMVWTQRSSIEAMATGATSPVAVTSALEMEPAISPDGMLVAYVAETPDGSRIFVRQIDGGRPVLLAPELDGDHRWPRWSPDQSRIVFTANDAAFVVPSLGGSPRRVIESPNRPVVTPSWSPDGKQLVYADDQGISVRSLDGAVRKVVDGAFLHSPSWSPDGGRLAYAKGLRLAFNNISTNTIWVVAAGGGSPRQLSDSIHVNVSPIWAPDGRSVLYISNRSGTPDVYQQPVRSDGSPVGAPHRLTTTLNAHSITLSASGHRLVYDVVSNRTTIWMAPIVAGRLTRTSAATRITEEKERIEGLSLSHDGNWLAYDSNRGGNFDIYKVRVEGGQPTQLTSDPANDFLPTWSADDREIAFHSTRNRTRDVYVVSAEGGAETQATSGPREDFAPYWSPDGRSLVFRGESAGVSRAFIVTRGAAAEWSAPRAVTPDNARELFAGVAWSPDGKVIAFMNRGMVAITGVDRGAVRVIADSTTLRGTPTFLTWGSDPSVLYVTAVARGMSSVVALPLGRGRVSRVMSEEGSHRMRPEFATDGRRIFFTLGAWESDVWVMGLKP